MNKLSLIAAMALGGLVACSTLATAQDATNSAPTSGAPKKGGKRGFPSIEQQMERLSERLTLTDEQKPKVKAVLEDAAKKRQALFTDSSVEPQQRREKMQALMEEQTKAMKGILTEEQFTKYEAMNQRRGKKGPDAGKKNEEKKSE
jgi:Spy/CpxP family protein refolding chaperone